MNVRCPKCNRELVPAAADQDDSRTLLASIPVCPDCGAATVDSYSNVVETAAPAQALSQVAHFRLENILGSGGFGDVWLATDLRLGRKVALKLSKARRREVSTLLFEAQTAASLRHPHIVSVHEVGEQDGQVYIVSDLIEGMTLADLLSAGTPPLGRTIELMVSISRALHFAHCRGVFHRDVKPANILVDHSGQPYVTDFGLAKRSSDTSSSGEGKMVGTIRYMSPEQAVGNFGQTDGRSDIYSLGVTLFEMLTGETPFRGNAQAILHQKTLDDAPSPRLLDPSLPRDLETICLKCLERDPGKRFQAAVELAEELERYAANEPIRSRPISRAERAWRWCQKRPAIAGLMAGLLISLSSGLTGVTYFWRSAVVHESDANHSLYRAKMNMAAIHLRSGDTIGIRDVLQRVADNPKLSQYRDFEWNYFDKQIAPISPIANLGTAVVDVAITRDGDFCAAVGGGTEVRVWDIKTHELVRTIVADQSGFQAVDFSPTSAQLATGSQDGYVRTYDPLVSARLVRQILHGPPVAMVCYSPNGQQLVAAGKSGAVRVWNPADGSLLAEFPTGKRGVDTRVLCFSPDGKKLMVAAADGQVRVWDMTFKTALPSDSVPIPLEVKIETRSLSTMTVDDDGQTLVSGNLFGAVNTFNLTDRSTSLFESHWGQLIAQESIPHTPLVILATSDGRLHIYDRELQNDIRDLYAFGLGQLTLQRSSNEKKLVLGASDGTVAVLEFSQLTRPAKLWHPAQQPVRSLDFLGSVSKLLVAYNNGDLWLWDTDKATYRRLVDNPTGKERIIAVHPNAGIFASGSATSIDIWDVKNGIANHALLGPSAGVTALRFSRSGNLLAIAQRAGPIRVYQTNVWTKPLWEIPGNEVGSTEVDFSIDETLLAITKGHDRVELVDTQRGETQRTIALTLEPSSLLFCNAGDELAIGTNTGEILLCDLTTGHQRLSIKGHTGRIHTLTQMPTGPNLISAGRDRILKLWDLPTGELIAPLAGHFRQIFAVAVSPDGKTIASGSLEGEVRLWRSQ